MQWSENTYPTSHTYEARVVAAGGSAVEGRSGPVTVVRRRWMDAVSLQLADETGGAVSATATAAKAVDATGYAIRILQDNHTVLATCSGGVVCTIASVALGHTYRAVIEDASGWALSSSATWTLATAGNPEDNSVGGIDLTAAAALFPSTTAICDYVLTLPGTHVLGSSVTDQWTACDVAVAAGATASGVLAAIAATSEGHDFLMALLTTTEDPRVAPPPVAPPASDPRGPGGGTGPNGTGGPPPSPVLTATLALAAILTTWDYTPSTVARLDEQQAEIVERQCLRVQGLSGKNPIGRCSGRLFVSGNDVQAATDHDIDAIFGTPGHDDYVAWPAHPQWGVLNYETSVGKSRAWLLEDPRCKGQLTPRVTQCDEFPYLASQQGGEAGSPSLRPISATSNVRQGGRYGNFITYCRLLGPPEHDPGTSFAVVPIPAVASGVVPIPTMGVCEPGDRP